MIGRKRNILIKFFTSQIFITLALLVILIVLAIPSFRNYQQRRSVDQEVNALKEEIAQAEAQNNDFRKMVEYLESEQFVEEQARLKLGLKKPGENVVVIQEQTPQTDLLTEKTIDDQPLINEQTMRLVNNFKKWIDFFFKTKLSQEWGLNP